VDESDCVTVAEMEY